MGSVLGGLHHHHVRGWPVERANRHHASKGSPSRPVRSVEDEETGASGKAVAIRGYLLGP